MLNNTDIISKLSDEQKIALVADVFSAASDAFGAAGVPHLERTDLDTLDLELNADAASPDFSALATAWNPKLAEFVAESVLSRADTARFNFVATPSLSVKTGPCASGMSEDPYLIAKITDAYVSAIEKSGARPCLTGCTLDQTETEYLDPRADDAVIYDVLARAAEAVIRAQKTAAAELSLRALKGDWKAVNMQIAERATSAKNTFVLRDAPEESFLGRLTDDNILFTGASVSALRSALKNYERMKEDVEHGSVGAEELEKAVAAGTAVSRDTLDTAVDGVIDRIRILSARGGAFVPKTDDECRSAALYAARECIVMLKNANALPLGSGVKLAVVGELAKDYVGMQNAVTAVCGAMGASFVGYADGYKLGGERSDDLIASATALAQSADAVLAFVGLGRKSDLRFSRHESINLPADQHALLDGIRKTGKKVIAAVVGDRLPNMKFDGAADAILFVPFGGGQTVKALCEIIFGAISPSGKLTSTAYDDADAYFEDQKQAVAAGRYKIGGFFGYRRYVSENRKVKYPFGFGLSYGKFVYSGLKIAEDNVELNVKNTGSVAAGEAVQLYIGKKSSQTVRAARELKGFAKVFVDPGKTVHIKFPLNSAMLEVYDRTDGKKKVEAGLYDIYICASATDVRLTGSVEFSGVKLEKSGDKLADYLPTVSNIVDDGYRMNAVSDGSSQFRSARPADGDISYAKLFSEEFDATDDDETDADADVDEDIIDFLDESVTVKTTADGLIKCAASMGVGIDPHTAYEITASFFASRVVMLRCDEAEFDMLHAAVCEYFGCPVCLDDTSTCADSDDILGEGDSALVGALAHAAAHRNSVTVAALDNVKPDSIGKIFTQFIRYSTAPDNIRVTFGAAKRSLEVTRNVWFMMRLANGKCEFPAYVAEMSEVVIPKIFAVTATDAKAYAPDFVQFLAACRRAENKFELDEAQWKKIDKLEAFAAERCAFKLGNKLCVQIERFASALLECGVDMSDVLDTVVADKLVPHIASALDGKLTAEDGSLADVLDGIFGSGESARMKLTARRAVGKEGA